MTQSSLHAYNALVGSPDGRCWSNPGEESPGFVGQSGR
jgi:hypothetical protein